MIHYVKGKLIQSTPSYAIVDVNGMGYKVFIPMSTYSKLPQVGQQVILYTCFVVRELSQALYGFFSEAEKELFEEVTNVSGIGPKIGLSLIGHLPAQDLYCAINNHDIAAISRVPGIGKKIAERLIIEMRDKLKTPKPSDFAIKLDKDPRGQTISDALNALINLGYKQESAQKAVKKSLDAMPDGFELSLLITHSLRNL